jgi:glyoxylase-like metal-dependent hydrolase (beta-lactamase superfamily II)
MEELRPGLWTWTAPHPEWSPSDAGPEGWGQDVVSAAVVSADELVLLDPLMPPEAVFRLADGRTVSVVLTCAWHRRSTAACVDRFGATVYVPRGGRTRLDVKAQGYDTGDTLPGGVVAAAAYYPEEAVLWLPEQRALFSGDAFVGPPFRFQGSWLPPSVRLDEALAGLRPLLDLPVELVLVAHGDPVLEGGHAALERALHAPSAA